MRSTKWRAMGLGLSLLAATGCVSLTPYAELIADVPPERLLEIGGRQVYVEDHGSGDPVLLVHGFGASSYSWRLVMEDLAQRYRVLAVDLSGFGLSARPRDKSDYSRYAQGEVVLGVLDALEIDRVHLVGHSYGGSVSVALAVRRPERVESLVLVDAAAPEYPQLRRSPWVALRPLTEFFVRVSSLRRSRVVKGLERSAADDSIVTDSLVDEYWRRVKVEGSPRAFWGLTAPLADPQGEVDTADLEMPTLVVWGEADTLIAAGPAREASKRIPASRFVLLPGVGHVPMEESPVELAQILDRFFGHGLAAFDQPNV